jgi:long-chain fatty acid transport protein
MPDVLAFGVRDDVSDRWTMLAEVDWTDWNRFHELRVVAANPAQPDDVTAGNWGGGWFGSLGADYRVGERWHLRGGVGYDASPIPASTLGPRIPDANRLWTSVGGRYDVSDATTVNLTLSELFNSDEAISLSPLQTGNALRGSLAGKTTSSVTVIGVQLSYRQP